MEDQVLDTIDPEEASPLPNGVTLYNGKYRIVKKLAQGTFGITYLAESCTQGNLGNITTKVAIKEFILQDVTQRSGHDTSVTGWQSKSFQYYKGKFMVEAKNLAKMSQYDDIVNVYDVFEENNTAYYSMEFIDGGSLDDYIKQCGKIPENQAIEYISKIASALKHLHDHKMLHLDLKPKNVMRRTDGKLYLIDFGLSKQYNESGKAESSNTIGKGTPGYAPIEQESFKGIFAPTLDIYALGATFYKMLTGATPPLSSDIFNDGFEPLVQKMRSVGVSEKTIAIVGKAMQLRKLDRYQTVDELLAVLPIQTSEIIETRLDEEEDKQSDNTQRATAASTKAAYSNDETKESKEERAKELNNSGEECYEKGDYNKAYKLFLRAAEMGNAKAMYNVGLCFEFGHHVTPSRRVAMEYYQKAAALNIEDAEKRLAVLRQVDNANHQNKQSDTQRTTTAQTQAASSYSNNATKVAGGQKSYGNGSTIKKTHSVSSKPSATPEKNNGKKIFWGVVFLILAVIVCAKMFALKPYAVYENETLTYYYGRVKPFGHYDFSDVPYEIRAKVKTVVLDKSFHEFQLTDDERFFMRHDSIRVIYGLENLNTTNIKDMSRMFSGCSNLTSLDVSGLNTENVEKMDSMFSSCLSLTNLDLSEFNTKNAKEMSGMFSKCSSLTSLDVSSLNTSNVKDMSDMFYGCSGLTSLDVSGLNTANVENMSAMFGGCSGLTSLDVSGLNTANVEDMHGMFDGCSSLTSLNISGLNTSKVKDMSDMFSGCSSLTSLDVSGLNTANVEKMERMFSGCSSLTSLDVSGFNMTNYKDMDHMFSNCKKLKTIYASDSWSKGSMDGIFWNCLNLIGGKGTKYNPSEFNHFEEKLKNERKNAWTFASQAKRKNGGIMSDEDFKKLESMSLTVAFIVASYSDFCRSFARIDGGPSAPGYFTRK